MEWTKFSLRHIALKIAYLGWDYHGLAAQHVEDEMPTIEVSNHFARILV